MTITAHTYFDVECDQCGFCLSDEIEECSTSQVEAKAQALANGWTVTPMLDLCSPECVAEQEIANEEAARFLKARRSDPEIAQWLKHQEAANG